MKKLTSMTAIVLLTLALSADRSRAIAQHHGGGRVAAPSHPAQAPRNGGQHVVPPHVQQKMMEQQRQYEQQMIKEQARQQQAFQKQYEGQANQFREWLKANGGNEFQGKAINLPKSPAEFDQWAATQQKRKAQGKSYEPLYDHFRSFAGSMKSSGAGGHGGQSAKSGHAQATKERNEKKSNTAEDARKEADRAKRDATKREEKTAKTRAEERRPLARDQVSISLLKIVHKKLQEADHDYQGHRVKAMGHVSQALHHLGSSDPAGFGSGVSLGNLASISTEGFLTLRSAPLFGNPLF